MSSISSSRKNRPNLATDATWPPAAPEPAAQADSIEICGNLAAFINSWREEMSQPKTHLTAGDYALARARQRWAPAPDAELRDIFVLWASPLATQGESIEVELDELGCVPPGTRVPRVDPLVYGWAISCPTQARAVSSTVWVSFDGAREPVNLTQLTPLTDAQLEAAQEVIQQREIAASVPPPPKPEPPRRAAIAEPGVNITGFVPGASLGFPIVPEGDISTREADYSAGGGFIEPETDLFALFAFHLAAPAVISAVTARITCSTGTYLPIALYDAAGQRLLQVHLRATQDGLVSEVLEKAVTLQAGCYRLGWATLHSELRVAALGIGRAERDFLNTAGGEIVVALGHGRQSYTLPKKLDKLELPPERFGLVPQIFLKG